MARGALSARWRHSEAAPPTPTPAATTWCVFGERSSERGNRRGKASVHEHEGVVRPVPAFEAALPVKQPVGTT